ncbi:MAG: HAMP domain-containing histidine kinase [Lachnospiraceae bacterium]|nr:HAMP domain-containing histidine kinase [Lachnospiraceae bacterium]
MSRLQKILLVIASGFYAFTLYAFLRYDMWLLLIGFILHSAALLLFAFVCFQANNRPTDELEELEERLVSVKEEWKSEADDLRSRLAEKANVINQKEDELKAALLDKEKLKADLDAAHIAAAEQSAAPAAELSASILPEMLPDRAESATVNVIDIARSVGREFHDDAIKAGVNIMISEGEEDLLVKADPNMLRILFRNIVDNSIKYMNRLGSLVITISSIGDDIFVVCKDTGDGLAEDETKHIFELNYQGSNRISGNGLGLYQAKAIVEYYGGTIYAKSTPGKGMGIYIQLPTT